MIGLRRENERTNRMYSVLFNLLMVRKKGCEGEPRSKEKLLVLPPLKTIN